MKSRQGLLTLVCSVSVLGACAGKSPGRAKNPCPQAKPVEPLVSAPNAIEFRDRLAEQDPAGRMRADMLCGRDPCSDFYAYACGAVARRSPQISTTDQQAITNLWLLWNIAQVAISDTGDHPDRARLAAFWHSCDDKAERSRVGIRPLTHLLEAIEKVEDPGSLTSALALLHRHGLPALFSLNVVLDDSRSRHVATLGPGATGLAADVYAAEDQTTIDRYRKYIATLMRRASGEVADVDAILAVERAVAAAELRVEDEDEPPVSESAPGSLAVDWAAYDASFDPPIRSRRFHPAYFEALEAALDLQDLAALKAYLRFTVLNRLASDLPPTVAATSADFYRDIGYSASPQSRLACVERLQRHLPDLMSHYYVGLTQDEEQKQRAATLAAEIHEAAQRRVAAASWMSPEGRAAALEKISRIQIFVGRGGDVDDYDDVFLDPQRYLDNVLELRVRAMRRALAKIGAPRTSRSPMSEPFRTNAWYSMESNAAMIPYALLAPPYFDHADPASVIYGRLGATIGHEVGHALVGKSRRYDALGRPSSWAAADAQAYDERTQCFVREYDGVAITRRQTVDGRRTLAENLADHLGLGAAWDAFQSRPMEAEAKVAGMSDEQAFFTAYAQVFCGSHDAKIF